MNQWPYAVLHVPHASSVIPPEVRASFHLDDRALAEQLRVLTDRYADELFDVGPELASLVRYPVSRLVVDPERFVDDSLEPMFMRGMGVIYTRTAHGEVLRDKPTPTERKSLLREFHEPHHDALNRACDAALEVNGWSLIFDCHSFPSKPLPFEPDRDLNRPDINVGTDPFHTPEWLAKLTIDSFEKAGFSVARDRPSAGALTPTKHYRTDPRVLTVMIEVNRSLYMDEMTGERNLNFIPMASRLQETVAGQITDVQRAIERRPSLQDVGR